MTDEQLIKIVQTGVIEDAQEAFAELVSRWYKRMMAYVYCLLVNECDAEDVTQELFIILWRKAHTYDPSRSKFSTWFYGIARHLAYEVSKKRKRLPDHTSQEEGGQDDSRTRAAGQITAEDLEDFRDEGIITSLESFILTKHYLEGYSYKDLECLIQDEFSISMHKNSIRVAAFRAKRKIREYLAGIE